jgi:hypothetical protein
VRGGSECGKRKVEGRMKKGYSDLSVARIIESSYAPCVISDDSTSTRDVNGFLRKVCLVLSVLCHAMLWCAVL